MKLFLFLELFIKNLKVYINMIATNPKFQNKVFKLLIKN